MKTNKDKVISYNTIPDKESEIETVDGRQYLITNDVMYTFFKRTKGELSPFFLALRDEKRLLGCKCVQCGLVRVPPFLTHCPDCNFAPTELIEVEQVGILNSTAPITYFATSLFQHLAPYGRGRVIFKGADTALSVNLFTTTGILVPGILNKGTEVKLIFRSNRIGEMTDVFCVPTSELSRDQVARHELEETEIDWESPVEPMVSDASAEDDSVYRETLNEIRSIVEEMNGNERARKDIAGWRKNIAVKARGGQFALIIDDGDIRIEKKEPSFPDFVMVSQDLRVLLDGLAYRGAITDSVINKKLWISKNPEFTTIFKLDRMARSVARSKKD